MSEADHQAARAAMSDLARGFARADRSALSRAVTDDFEWHMHWQEAPTDEPTGEVLRGLDEVMDEIDRRRRSWSDLRDDDMEERYLDDLVVQTFTVSGVDAGGVRFHCAAVDLYAVRDGRLSSKQTTGSSRAACSDEHRGRTDAVGFVIMEGPAAIQGPGPTRTRSETCSN